MSSSKDGKRLEEEIELKEVEAKENINPNKNSLLQSETENEDKLQTDTSSESKDGNWETPPKSDEQDSYKKRSVEDSSDNNTTPTKKVRNKPKPQVIENMKEYVDNNTIEKLTTTTLLHWLRQRNLHCSTRDKKAELIQKVKNHFSNKS